MITFKGAHQIRSSLKMKLSLYSWYNSSCVLFDKEGYYIVVHVKKIDNKVRKIIPPVIDGISIRTESDRG